MSTALFPALRGWLKRQYGLSTADANDDKIVNDLVWSAIKDGTLTRGRLAALKRGEDGDDDDDDDDGYRRAPSESEFNSRVAALSQNRGGNKMVNPYVSDAGDSPRVRVKGASESYSTAKSVGCHIKSGKPVVSDWSGKQPAMLPSEWELARFGSWMKFRAARDGVAGVSLTDHDLSIVGEVLAKDRFSGLDGNRWETGIEGQRVKALLDSSTSGGSYLNPVWFDQMLVTYPLLFGELAPFVETVDVPRSSSIEGAAVSTPTVVWGTAEGTSQDAFDTASLVSQISATIFAVAAFVEVGRDLMADADPLALGQQLVALIGERIASELDVVISVGNGTTQPEGIFQASGISSISSANASAAAYTIGDAEQHIFGIGKQYRRPEWNPSWVGGDAQYRRLCSVPVGEADDRRVMKDVNNYHDYTLLGYPYRVQDNAGPGITAFGSLRKGYRLWRRQGQEVRWTDQGSTLVQKNTTLLAVRGRYAGKVVDTNAFVKMTDGDSTDG